MNKCGGHYNCYPNCEECPRYMDDCDGSEEMQEMEEDEKETLEQNVESMSSKLIEKWSKFVDNLMDGEEWGKNLKIVPYVEDHSPCDKWWGDL